MFIYHTGLWEEGTPRFIRESYGLRSAQLSLHYNRTPKKGGWNM